MRLQGRISSWNDDRGFGFVTLNGGVEPVFLHIRAFANKGRRPVGGEIVTYDLTTDPNGRARAVNVAFVEARSRLAASAGGGANRASIPMVILLFFAFIVACALAGRLPMAVVGLYAATSLVTFTMYAWDKSAAENNRWRTRESSLHMIALLGGWPGALVAQRVLRHKSSKASFRVIFRATVLINCGLLAWLLAGR